MVKSTDNLWLEVLFSDRRLSYFISLQSRASKQWSELIRLDNESWLCCVIGAYRKYRTSQLLQRKFDIKQPTSGASSSAPEMGNSKQRSWNLQPPFA